MALGKVERECERQGRELLRRLLQDHVDARGDGDVGAAICVDTPEGPLVYAHKRVRTRRHVTVFGEITVTRMGYGRPGQASIHPLDAQLGLPARCYSYELQRRLVTAAVHAPFDDAVGILAETTGVRIPKRSAEQLVIDAPRNFDAFYRPGRPHQRRAVRRVDLSGCGRRQGHPHGQARARRQDRQVAQGSEAAEEEDGHRGLRVQPAAASAHA